MPRSLARVRGEPEGLSVAYPKALCGPISADDGHLQTMKEIELFLRRLGVG